MDLNKSGERIKELRLKRGYSGSKLAELCDGFPSESGRSKVSRWEKGIGLDLDNLQRLADALECDIEYLLGCQEHPDATTSWIAEQIPLRRDAIESLVNMKYRLDEWSDSESLLMGYNILSDIIIHIEESLHADVIDNSGKVIEHDSFLGNIIDLLFAYESIAHNEDLNGTPFKIDRSYRNEKLTIRGASSWLGSDIAEVIRKSIKTYADPERVLSEEA